MPTEGLRSSSATPTFAVNSDARPSTTQQAATDIINADRLTTAAQQYVNSPDAYGMAVSSPIAGLIVPTASFINKVEGLFEESIKTLPEPVRSIAEFQHEVHFHLSRLVAAHTSTRVGVPGANLSRKLHELALRCCSDKVSDERRLLIAQQMVKDFFEGALSLNPEASHITDLIFEAFTKTVHERLNALIKQFTGQDPSAMGSDFSAKFETLALRVCEVAYQHRLLENPQQQAKTMLDHFFNIENPLAFSPINGVGHEIAHTFLNQLAHKMTKNFMKNLYAAAKALGVGVGPEWQSADHFKPLEKSIQNWFLMTDYSYGHLPQTLWKEFNPQGSVRFLSAQEITEGVQKAVFQEIQTIPIQASH